MAVYRLDHPLIADRIAVIRNRDTETLRFRAAVDELSGFLAYEFAGHLPTREVTVATPVAPAICRQVKRDDVVLAPILRAGLGLVPGVQHVFPKAPVLHLGIYRDEDSLKPVFYYRRASVALAGAHLVLLDPMLATGGTVIAALELLAAENPGKVTVLCLLASEDGLQAVTDRFGDVDIFAGAVDPELNDRGYIVPGLGDAGDRMFGTD